jgi:hypothetical protein
MIDQIPSSCNTSTLSCSSQIHFLKQRVQFKSLQCRIVHVYIVEVETYHVDRVCSSDCDIYRLLTLDSGCFFFFVLRKDQLHSTTAACCRVLAV